MIVILALEKSLSGSADIVGIDRISIAILLKFRKPFCCISLSLQERAVKKLNARSELQ